MRGISILIVEDDAFTRSALAEALRFQGMEIIGAVQTVKDAIECAKTGQPQVAICDLDLGPGPSGIDVALTLRKILPNIGIVMLTSYRDPRLVEPNLPPPPQGAILLNKKELTSMTILGMSITEAVRRPLLKRNNSWVVSGNFRSLSVTQVEIFKKIAQGKTTAEIAQMKNVSEQSVERITNRICRNLEIPLTSNRSQRVQLVRAYFYGAGREF